MGLLHDAGLAAVYEQDIFGLNDLLDKLGERGLPIDQQRRLFVAAELGEQRLELLKKMELLLPLNSKRFKVRKTEPKVEGWIEGSVIRLVRTCTVCNALKPNKKHPCRKLESFSEELVEVVVKEWCFPIPFTPSLDMLKRYCLAKGYKVPTKRDKQTGQIRQTMDETAIRRMALSHSDDQLFALVLEYREKDKQLGTYTGRIV